MQTAETDEKARQVSDCVAQQLPGASVEYRYIDKNPQPVAPGIEPWQPRQESQFYLYRVTAPAAGPTAAGPTAVEVTLDAMQYGDVTETCRCIMDAVREGAGGRARVEWRAERLITLWQR